MMWQIGFVVLAGLVLSVAWYRGPNRAAGIGAISSLLIPTWIQIDFYGFPLDMRVGLGIFALSVYCLHRRSVFRTRLVAVDYAALTLVGIHIASDWLNDGVDWSVPLRAYGEWGVPYFLGRLAIRNWNDVRALTPALALVSSIYALAALVEATLEYKLFELVFGGQGLPASTRRWGFLRAYGPTKNPIFFGCLQLLFVPWTLYAAVLAYRDEAPRWWFGAPVLSAIGIFLSASRAPILGLMPILFVVVFATWRRSRTFLMVAAVLAVVGLGVGYRQVLDVMHTWSGEASRPSKKTVVVDGATVKYTSTLHRFYLVKVYANAMRQASWLGFGTDATAKFPPRVPVGAEHAQTLKRLWCIDNFYVLFILRFGHLGILTFVFLSSASFWCFLTSGLGQGLRRAVFAGAMAGTVLAMLLVLVTVWMPHDFGFWFVWTMAAGAGLQARMSES